MVTPALCLVFLQHIKPSAEPPLLHRRKDVHGAWLARLGARPWPIVAVAASLSVLALACLFLFRAELLPSVHDDHLLVTVRGPPGTSIAASRDYGARIAAALIPLDGVQAVSQRIGRDPTGDDSWGPERSVFDIALAPGLGAAAQQRLAVQVLDKVRAYPGLDPQVSSRFDTGQGGLAAAAPVRISVYGQDLDALDEAATRIAAVIKALPGARDVRVQDQARTPVVRADINFQRLALYGLSSADVLDTVQAAFAGERVAQIYQDGRVVDLAVSAQTSLRRDPEAIGDLLLRSTSTEGISVPLKSVANVYLTDDRAVIAHDGGLRRQVITAAPGDPGRFLELARQAIAAKVTLPLGAFVEYAGAGQAEAAARGQLLINYALAIFGIVALLAIAFDGRTGALILASTLFAFVGAVAAVALMGGVMSVGVIVGFIALFGLSMRGAILVFGELEDLILSGRAAWSLQTVVLATRERVTPLLMTPLLVALGLAPLAVHAGQAGREILGPMAIVIIGGLLTGTLRHLSIVLPALIYALWNPAYARRARRHGGFQAASLKIDLSLCRRSEAGGRSGLGLAEAGDALGHVRAAALAAKDFVRQAGLKVQAVGVDQQPLVGPMAEPGIGQDGSGQGFQFGVKGLVGHAHIGQPHGSRLGPGIGAAGEHHLARLIGPHPPRQALAHPPDRGQGPAGVGIGELGVLRGEDDVAGQGQFERPGITVAVHGADHRLRQVGQPLDDAGLEVRPRQPLAGGDVAKVVAGGETAAGAAHDDQADALSFALQPFDLRLQRPKEVHIQRVQLVRPIEDQARRAVPVLADDQFVHELRPCSDRPTLADEAGPLSRHRRPDGFKPFARSSLQKSSWLRRDRGHRPRGARKTRPSAPVESPTSLWPGRRGL